jgi:hypothetical protein
MSCLKPIGGFFELELPSASSGYHPDALALSNGRACMSWILSYEKPSRVFIPFYTCDALFEPMERLGIEIEYYPIDLTLNPIDLPRPQKGELLIVINYFGLKNQLVQELSENIGRRLVIDDTHAYFNKGYAKSYSFTSARKYFGVPDGAYLYGADKSRQRIERNADISIEHNVYRLLGFQEEAYKKYLTYERSLSGEVKGISILSEKLLSQIDYEKSAQARVSNFHYLHDKLKSINKITLDLNEIGIPFCYPLLPETLLDLKYFHQRNIFIPRLWPDVLNREIQRFYIEKDLAERLLPLPIDHRYGDAEMKRIVDSIFERIVR